MKADVRAQGTERKPKPPVRSRTSPRQASESGLAGQESASAPTRIDNAASAVGGCGLIATTLQRRCASRCDRRMWSCFGLIALHHPGLTAKGCLMARWSRPGRWAASVVAGEPMLLTPTLQRCLAARLTARDPGWDWVDPGRLASAAGETGAALGACGVFALVMPVCCLASSVRGCSVGADAPGLAARVHWIDPASWGGGVRRAFAVWFDGGLKSAFPGCGLESAYPGGPRRWARRIGAAGGYNAERLFPARQQPGCGAQGAVAAGHVDPLCAGFGRPEPRRSIQVHCVACRGGGRGVAPARGLLAAVGAM